METELHCEACREIIEEHVKRYKGVLAVNTNMGSGMASDTLRVLGFLDPYNIRDYVTQKFGKWVEILSVKTVDDAVAARVAELKELQLGSSTAVLTTRLGGEGCMENVKQILLDVNGVKAVHIDGGNGLVIVEGTMDVNTLPLHLKDKLKHNIEVFQMEIGSNNNSGYKNNSNSEEGGSDRILGEEKENHDTENSDTLNIRPSTPAPIDSSPATDPAPTP
ncbi:uncharacterized protein LOC110026096 [Phalaenopsis equestris]|uniref:uncharacterized protein LOC110026096 n=1 Tax=Phalaenopsis equestris TaxID=78828 RepID=UPI0009E5759B|nr:uncharacterized protein LOC110026096 [Phalaenopsis equestris]